MTPSHSSPLAFAREFERFKVSITQHPADIKLLVLLEFWQKNNIALGDTDKQVYRDQMLAICENSISEESIVDFSLDELRELREHIDKLIRSSASETPDSIEARNTLTKTLAKTLFYIGEIHKAVDYTLELTSIESPNLLEIDDLKDLDPHESLRILCERCKETQPDLCVILNDIYNEWFEILSGHSDDSVWCALVKQDKGANRGHLQCFSGKVFVSRSVKGQDGDDDLVSFEHKINDPAKEYEGAVRNALLAVRGVVVRYGVRVKGILRAYFRMNTGESALSGASIGLATGLIAFTQLLRAHLVRHVHTISTAVAVTGALDKRGRLQAVNDETLKFKLERVFFSPLKYFVMPEQNLASAKVHLDELTKEYPCRRLLLLGARSLSEVSDNLNVIHKQTLQCFPLIINAARKYSGATALQVPLLVALLWVLLALLIPRFFNPFFDNNPAQVEQVGNGFKVLNANGDFLWEKELDCEGINAIDATFFDISGDSQNEVAVRIAADGKCGLVSKALIYSYDGDSLLLTLDASKPGKYPPRYERDVNLTAVFTRLVTIDDRRILVTQGPLSNPSQMHIKVWDSYGKELGWYINAGTATFDAIMDINQDGHKELLCRGLNRRMRSACFYGLNPDSTYGASPPYKDTNYELEWVEHGNQLFYAVFPPTDVCLVGKGLVSNNCIRLTVESSEIVRLITRELYSDDVLDAEKYTVQYYVHYVDGQMRVSRVDFSDGFERIREDLIDSGLVDSLPLKDYREVLANKVSYWTDSGWITEGQLRAAEAANSAKSGD